MLMTQSTPTRGRTKLYVGIGVIIIASATVLVLFFTGFSKPKVEITTSILRKGGGLVSNYWVSEDISLYNHRWSGKVTVWTEITYEPTQESWKKAQTAYIGSEESKDVTMEFTFDTAIYFADFLIVYGSLNTLS